MHRKAHVIALGGGALSDFAGFVAATLLRGLSWSIIPTTLLSMVDASIGGKVAINSQESKNLIGAFHLPENVWINLDSLKTLSKGEVDSGKGEIVKYCFLSEDIYCLAINNSPLEMIVKSCADYKVRLTSQDFKEGNQRKFLNLGHTFGHAIEQIYQLPHGVAIIWGMLIMFELFPQSNLKEELKTLVKHLDLDLSVGSPWFNKTFPIDKIMDHIRKDKKVMANNQIDLVLINAIGEPFLKPQSLDKLEQILEQKKNELKKLNL